MAIGDVLSSREPYHRVKLTRGYTDMEQPRFSGSWTGFIVGSNWGSIFWVSHGFMSELR